jgi:hypothetical protein
MPEGKRPLGRPRRRWIDNIKMGLLVIGLSVVDWIGLAQDRYRWTALVNAVMNSIKCWESTEWLHNLWLLERYSAPQVFHFCHVCAVSINAHTSSAYCKSENICWPDWSLSSEEVVQKESAFLRLCCNYLKRILLASRHRHAHIRLRGLLVSWLFFGSVMFIYITL